MDVKADARHMARLLDLTHGRREVPVILQGEEVIVGFGGT